MAYPFTISNILIGVLWDWEYVKTLGPCAADQNSLVHVMTASNSICSPAYPTIRFDAVLTAFLPMSHSPLDMNETAMSEDC